jgi:hypothetical protein
MTDDGSGAQVFAASRLRALEGALFLQIHGNTRSCGGQQIQSASAPD